MSDQPVFGRVLTAMVTPMAGDGAVDLEGAASLAKRLLEDGNDGLVLNGTTGESPTTSDAEKSALVRAVRAAVGDDVPLVAGVGTNDTAHSMELAAQAREAGASALLVVTPYYSKPSQEGVLAHFEAVADAGALPVMLYDIPGRAGITIAADTLRKAAEHPLISAVKDATGDLGKATAVLRSTDLWWYSGDDALNLPFLSIGAVGYVSVAGHLVADRLRDMLDAFDTGRNDAAADLFYSCEPVAVGLFRAPAVSLTKAALALRGLPGGPPRLPLLPATQEQVARLVADLVAGGVDVDGSP